VDTTQITHISLCSGYGGIDLGLRRVIPNLRTIAYAEIEAFACENLLARMEGGQLDAAPIWSDLNVEEQKIQDISGHLSQVAFKWYDPDCVSSRTCRDTLALDLEKSLQTWKALVTKRRGEYSARLNAARLTSDAEFTSLPTPCANEDSFRLNGNSQQSRCLEARARRGELGEPGPLNPQFVEIMMGLPIGWTDCASSETE